MRKENKTLKNVKLASVQGYHAGGYATGSSEGYAFVGFPKGFCYYTSDRYYPVENGKVKVNNVVKAPEGYGLEVELQCKGIKRENVLAEVMEKIIFPHFQFSHMWKMQRDSSLGGDTSVECITGVMAQSRIRNDWPAWKSFFDVYLPSFGISADSYSTSCGMHVNVSTACFGKNPDEAIRKLYYIMNKHYDVFRKLFYRASDKTTWCQQMDYSVARTMDLHYMSASHHNCLNYSHYDAGRIEIRLVGGQKDFDTFRKTMEAVFFLVDRVKSISWADCDDISKIFTGVNQYVLARLENMHVANDYIREHAVHDEKLDYIA